MPALFWSLARTAAKTTWGQISLQNQDVTSKDIYYKALLWLKLWLIFLRGICSHGIGFLSSQPPVSLYCANSPTEGKRSVRIKANTPRTGGLGPGKERWVPTGNFWSKTWHFGEGWKVRHSYGYPNSLKGANGQACVIALKVKLLDKDYGSSKLALLLHTISLLSLTKIEPEITETYIDK